jgi:hypothetical protein
VGGPAGSTFAAGAVRTGLEEDRRNLVGMAEASRRNSRCREGTVAAGRPGCKAQRRDGSVEAVVGIGEVHPDCIACWGPWRKSVGEAGKVE